MQNHAASLSTILVPIHPGVQYLRAFELAFLSLSPHIAMTSSLQAFAQTSPLWCLPLIILFKIATLIFLPQS